MEAIKKFFRIEEKHTTVSTEIIAGLTTFMTMAYVLLLQPTAIVGGNASIIDCAGVEVTKTAIMIMCAFSSGFVTLGMSFYANLPFALSTGMGSNFLLGAMIQAGTLSFAQSMGIIMVSGIVFVILSAFGIRDLVVRMIPRNLKIGISSCIGFFIAYLGLKNSGICDFSSGLAMGDFTNPTVIMSLVGLAVIAVLTAYKVKGATLVGIIITTILCIIFGITNTPSAIVSVPSFADVKNVCLNMDLKTIWTPECLILMFSCFCGDFFSTLGTVLGVAAKGEMLDEDGNFPDIGKPFIVDALGTCWGALTGCTTITTYVESSSGVEAGGRTGLTSFVTAVMFFLAIFFSPLVSIIPDCATGPALIFVGYMMISGFKDIDFSDFSEAFGPFIMLMFTTFMGSIAAGLAAGILAHIFIKLALGKFSEIHIGMYIFAIPLVLYFII